MGSICPRNMRNMFRSGPDLFLFDGHLMEAYWRIAGAFG